MKRRSILKSIIAAPVITTGLSIFNASTASEYKPASGWNLKTSLNAFSFNADLKSGKMSLNDLLEFCAEQGFDALDSTAYYFPEYPEVPSDEFLYKFKRDAFLLGIDISGTGVRNDFTEPDANKRKADIQIVKNWIDAAEKIGAPVIRVFAGKKKITEYPRNEIVDWMIPDMKECADYGEKHGVIVAIQNHNDFIKTADQVIEIIERVNSKWFGLVLDYGSFREHNAFEETQKAIPHAVNWQLKEKLHLNGKEVDTDLTKVLKIIRASNYKGYLPIETLGKGDPKVKVAKFFKKVKQAMYS